MESDNLSFSKDVADTIGVEAAVILKFIEDNKISSSSIEDIAEIILEKFSFMEERKIVSSIEKIASLGLIKIKSNKYSKDKLKLPQSSKSDKSKKLDNKLLCAKELQFKFVIDNLISKGSRFIATSKNRKEPYNQKNIIFFYIL